MFELYKKIIACFLVFEIICCNFVSTIVIAQETASSLKMEIDSLKNQVLKLQSDVYTQEQSAEDPECASITMMLANIEGEILGAEAKKKQANKDVEKKKIEKKKLQDEISEYERMYANSVDKSIIYGIAATAGIAGMVALGISNKKIQDRINKGDYPTDGARCLQGAGQVDYSSLGRWKNACQMCCLKVNQNNRESCKASCESAEIEVRKDIERQVNNANISHEELNTEREQYKSDLSAITEAINTDY